VVHQVGDAGDGGRRERQLFDEGRLRARRRRDVRLLAVVDVVREPDRDAALRRGDERALDDLPQVVREVEVVDRDLERLLRVADEVRERVRRPLSRLRSVGERVDVDQDAFARISALCARFAAW
jgi:hypothetical protein